MDFFKKILIAIGVGFLFFFFIAVVSEVTIRVTKSALTLHISEYCLRR